MLRNFGRRSEIIKRTFMSSQVRLEKPVLFHVRDTARVVTLNRPKKLNALNEEMCESMFSTLNEYAKSDCAQLVVLKSVNQPRSFCAGGDVSAVAENNVNGRVANSVKLFTAEYSLNFQMATYLKPIVAFMDGITMGGGVGLSIHTPFRVATENTKWAMPEMDIGLFPDVGTTFALPRVITLANTSGQMALYLALTGDVISGEDAYMLGLASHYVKHENLSELETRLAELKAAENTTASDESFFSMVNGAVEEYSSQLPKNYRFRFSNDQLNVIERCFDIAQTNSIKHLLQKLDEVIASTTGVSPEAKQFAIETKTKLLQKSPTSLSVALRLLQENSKDNIESSLKRDLYTATNFCVAAEDKDSPVEFSQAGIHKLIKKQKTPYPWRQTIDNISPSKITALVSPKPSMPVSLWRNLANVTWKQYPHHLKYQLPTEAAIKDYILGHDGQNDALSITRNEVISHFTNFNKAYRGKIAVGRLCEMVIERKCTVDDTGIVTWNQ
ncbi:hypothetical protein HG537_0D04290 [Torulaspora globosa]|uniref:3-hydroxyisobutyryl-CoA hydrolase n=1 Tax=Torulaspora globosa TaxID=48254 RepID=A0A7H9HSY6_9SACH|nr:hypothetical protein HG537_0D04290 [Torulaspora sp. CBS 2947]